MTYMYEFFNMYESYAAKTNKGCGTGSMVKCL